MASLIDLKHAFNEQWKWSVDLRPLGTWVINKVDLIVSSRPTIDPKYLQFLALSWMDWQLILAQSTPTIIF